MKSKILIFLAHYYDTNSFLYKDYAYHDIFNLIIKIYKFYNIRHFGIIDAIWHPGKELLYRIDDICSPFGDNYIGFSQSSNLISYFEGGIEIINDIGYKISNPQKFSYSRGLGVEISHDIAKKLNLIVGDYIIIKKNLKKINIY